MKKIRRKLPSGICQRKDGRFQGRFTFNGKRYTIYDRDLDTLKKKLIEAQYELEHGVYGNATNLTMNQWFDIWLTEYKLAVVKNSTIMLYTSNYNRYIRYVIGGRSLRDIKTLHVQKLYMDMKKQGLSLGTIQIVNAILNNLFSQAIKNDILTKNPCVGAVLPKETKKEPRVMTRQEQKVFMEILKDNFYEAICLLALSTGLRIGELTALKWSDIDFKHHIIRVERTLLYQKDYHTGENTFRCQTPKSETSKRQIPMIKEVEQIIMEHREKQRLFILKRGSAWKPLKGMEDLVFTTRNGTPVQEVYLVKTLQKITEAMNKYETEKAKNTNRPPIVYKKITPHTLRHTFATRAFENGLAPKTVQEILGHAKLSITMDLYTHVTLETKKKEMRKLEGILLDSVN